MIQINEQMSFITLITRIQNILSNYYFESLAQFFLLEIKMYLNIKLYGFNAQYNITENINF